MAPQLTPSGAQKTQQQQQKKRDVPVYRAASVTAQQYTHHRTTRVPYSFLHGGNACYDKGIMVYHFLVKTFSE